MAIAYTTILHGMPNGDVVRVEEGEDVKALPKKVIDELTELGVIGPDLSRTDPDEDIVAENEELKAQIEALQKEVEAAKAAAAKTAEPTKPAAPAAPAAK